MSFLPKVTQSTAMQQSRDERQANHLSYYERYAWYIVSVQGEELDLR